MALKPIYNPLSGEIEFAYLQDSVELAQKVQETFTLYGPAAVGDLVVPSANQAESVEAISSNYYSNLVLGVITGFVDPTTVKVLVSGKLTGASNQLAGLTFGQAIFVSSLGKITTTPPTSGHLQAMGTALKQDVVFLLISPNKVIRA